MMSYKDKCKMQGLSSSLEDSPCISTCTLTYLTPDSDKCICGRNTKQIANWNSYNSLTKKKIVMNCMEDELSFPRQKLTNLADKFSITFDKAKKVFVD